MLSQTSSSVSFWTEPEVNLHTLSACACMYQWAKTQQGHDLLKINEAHKLPNMPITYIAVPCGVSLYVLSLLLRHSTFACMKCACIVCTCVFYVADIKLFNAFSAAVLSVSAKDFKIRTNSRKYCAHGSVMPHLSLFVCMIFHREWGLTGSLKGLRQTFMIHC